MHHIVKTHSDCTQNIFKSVSLVATLQYQINNQVNKIKKKQKELKNLRRILPPLQKMGEIESDQISSHDVPMPPPRRIRKQSLVDVMGTDDLLESIQHPDLSTLITYPEIDVAIAGAVSKYKEIVDNDLKLQAEVDLIKYLIHKAKTILDDATHSPLLDRDTLTVLSCNVNAITADEFMKLQQMFGAEKCFHCKKNFNYCGDCNHDSIKCIFEDTTCFNQIDAIVKKYGHRQLRQYKLHDLLLVYRMYKEKGLFNSI